MKRTSAPLLLAAVLCCLLVAVPAATAAEYESLEPYEAVVDSEEAGILGDAGVDIGHAGYRPERTAPQRLEIELFPSQAAELRRDGVELRELQLPRPTAAEQLSEDISPNPFYNVYRSYSEEGGIEDEIRQIAADHPDIVKLVRIGTSTLDKPILALKITKDARNTPDGTRKAVLYSSINHAREWIAAETGRRLMNWFVDNRDTPLMRNLLETRELWLLPIQNPDGYDYTFTCGVGAENHLCGPTETPTNRLWRKSLRDNNGNGIFGDPQDGVDPNRNYSTNWNLDDEGSNSSSTPGPTAGHGRCRSPRTWPTTACCARCSSRRSSTTTRRRSSCCTRSGSTPT